MEISRKVFETIKKHSMLKEKDRVLVALSGGADSVCLLILLDEIKDKFKITLEAAHVNHKLRGKAAERDMNFVRELCKKRGITLHILEKDIKEYSKENHLSCEEAGRIVRYEFFKSIDADIIATAHTKDDNCENFFISALRGTKIMGVPPKRDNIIRPLINITKKDIYAFLKERKQSFCVDKTNFKTDFFRNKVRIDLIPYINRKFKTDLSEILENNLDVMYEENCFLDEIVDQFLRKCDIKRNEVRIDLKSFNELHIALKRRILRKIYYDISSSGYISYLHTQNIIDLSEKMKTGKKLTLCDDIVAEISYDNLVIKKETKNDGYIYQIELDKPCLIPAIDSTVMLSNEKESKSFFYSNDEKFIIRTRQNGDRLTLKNNQHKKLSDFFTDKKIPRDKRDIIPVISDSDGICAVKMLYLRKEKKEIETKKVYIHIEKGQIK